MVTLFLVAAWAMGPTTSDLKSWTFDTEADLRAWVPNGALRSVTLKDGVVSADAVDWDPFFTCKGIEIQANPWQFIVLRMKASRPGMGEVFWSGQTTGKYDGFSPDKNTPFRLKGDGNWEEAVILPFWQTEGVIRQLRLDVYNGSHFEIDAIRVCEWGADKPPLTDAFVWSFKGDTSTWRVHPAADVLLAPRLHLPVTDKGWVTVQLRSDQDASCAIVWSTQDMRGLQSRDFSVRGGNLFRHYNIELVGLHEWRDPVVAFGIQLPRDVKVELDSIRIAAEPSGPPEVVVPYFGFENGVNRMGRPCRVLAQFGNRGGAKVESLKARLVMPAELTCTDGSPEQTIGPIEYDEQIETAWSVSAGRHGEYRVRLVTEGPGAAEPVEAVLRFLPPLNLPKASYVPEPRPVPTEFDVCMYYFPGWDSDARWDCIRRVAPIRKPLLGYYDEANPECVDWQIKWSVENGITCYLVDWYWVAGRKHLEHWFDAYRKAKHRKYLKVAIMWANHNPPNTHSRQDWRDVTREWIDKYFPLETYYHIEDKPAVFIWSPDNIRHDLKGSPAVVEAFKESQEMARAAGHRGITFIAMHGHESAAGVKALLEEGYYGATDYHEWGGALQRSANPKRADYGDIVATVRESWERKVARCRPLVYYPVVDTGWDSRPWHGDKSLVISGRTPDRFEDILRQAKAYCRQIGRNIVILGPANEWGEGSYIEPNTEFEFEMMERVRKVFAKGEPASWPVNVAPGDVGLGPYDLPRRVFTTRWTFKQDTGGWSAMMGVSDLALRDGAMRFKTTTRDPAIMVNAGGLRAKGFSKLVLRMQITGPVPPGDHGQLFFSVGGQAMTEATSFRFPLAGDGQMHTYTIDLTGNPRWRSRIATLRLDPCGTEGVDVAIEEIRLE